MKKIKMTDSWSDGMCGWEEWMNTETGKKVKVRWNVYHPDGVTTSARARELAKELLLIRRS